MYIHPQPSVPNPNSAESTLLVQEQEMNKTLQEALTCTTCIIRATKETMRRDLKTGAYDPARDPPFLHSHSRSRSRSRAHDGYGYDNFNGGDDDDGEETSPLDTPRPKPTPRYAGLITESQRQEYQDCVAEALELQQQSGSRRKKRALDEEEDVRFAYYQVDYHIHLHDRARCSMLTLCRDIEDVRQMRGWETDMAHMDLDWGWDIEGRKETKEDELFTVHQSGLWQRRWMHRQRRVSEARKKWAVSTAERKRQREEMFRRQNPQAKVRLYCKKKGDKVLLREFSV